MKKILSIALAAAAIFAVSCQKPEPLGPVNGFHPVNEEGTAYVALGLNLPTTAATKANDVFDDGEGYEYTIENGTLVIFAGKDVAEDGLTLRSAYNLNHGQWNKDSETQITTTRTITQQIMTANITTGETLYALVILNKHKFFSVAASGAAADITTLFQGSTELTNTTFATFKKILLNEADKDFSNQSFTMTNMPYAEQTGGSHPTTATAPKTLVEINSEAIYGTKEEAETSAPAAEINVERLVAKVSVKYAFTSDFKDGAGNLTLADKTTKLTNLGWFIDNTNPTTYVVRNVEDPVGKAAGNTEYTYLTYNVSSFYRMISANTVRPALNQARTFWGIDSNYNADATGLVTEAGKVVNNELMNFNAEGENIGGRLRPADSHYYCPENTFDVKHQTVKNTTRVILAASFNGGASFYTISTEQGTIRSEADMKQYIADDILARVDVVNWLQKYLDSPATATPEQLRAIFTVTITTDGAAAGKALASIALNETGLAAVITNATKLADAKTAWTSTLAASQTTYIAENINNQLNFYKDGVAYYQALIRHFDNTETPWEGNTQMENKTESIYDGNDENAYLGRYGVVRNNWYDITITGIRQIGSSVVPPLTDEPDDTVEQFISIRINIMPWAVRTQNVIL